MRKQTILFLFFLLQLLCLIAAKKPNYLTLGSSLSVKNASSDQLTSPDKTFTCGFYSTGANAYWFGIWFTTSSTVVWVANRDTPVNGHGSRLSLRKNGALVLTDFGGSTVWETNTSTTNVIRGDLLNSGNLVLKDPMGHILWQSFDYPTDTLLPNQQFTRKTKLISRLAPNVFTSGYYSFLFDNDNVLKLIYDGPEISSIYWPNTDFDIFHYGRTTYNSSRIANLNDEGAFGSSDLLYFHASDMGIGIKRRLTIDHDGNLRLYSLNVSSGFWVITWQAVFEQCRVSGRCGINGICVYTPEPKCSCPPYHEPSDLSDLSKGCKPTFTKSCSDSHFVMMRHVDYYGFDLSYIYPMSFKDCRQLCLNDCRCQAFSYRPTGVASCYIKNYLFNGYRSNDFMGNIYLRVSRRVHIAKEAILNVSHLDCGSGIKLVVSNTTYEISNQRFKWAYLYSFLGAIFGFEVIISFVGWWFLFKNHVISTSLENGYMAILSQFRSFSYAELKHATGKFKEVLGSGGFGAVYKGVLPDQRVIAVKKLEGVVQGDEEFWSEVSIIGKINHMNLARMWGFCSEGKHRLLVYEHVENGSLDKHLFPSSANNDALLGWKERFKIALGTAKGLAYLHHECLEWVIHHDVKPENILLDTNFEPKISDFGLAKLCQRDCHESSEILRIRGTKGYMAPEWITNLPLTAKTDVYSYGVVILELVRGIRLSSQVVDDYIGEDKDDEQEELTDLTSFVSLAKTKIQNGEESWIEGLVDPRLEGRFSKNQAALMIEVGISCVDNDRNKRPTMESVTQILSECDDDTVMHTPETM